MRVVLYGLCLVFVISCASSQFYKEAYGPSMDYFIGSSTGKMRTYFGPVPTRKYDVGNGNTVWEYLQLGGPTGKDDTSCLTKFVVGPDDRIIQKIWGGEGCAAPKNYPTESQWVFQGYN